ncbi:hypothetical protein N658DRAFT_496404 [Parathielavia hyrcaniae]|uniref:Uncharacterized protein n=1 Tax=Parathielavia hyrcaniae TaxID=113614 RepID=A0AAN6Q0U9_9PEZI|nr:hypothetical protein N658DRAFT_496404 [Parathielavia hyrcaniae]
MDSRKRDHLGQRISKREPPSPRRPRGSVPDAISQPPVFSTYPASTQNPNAQPQAFGWNPALTQNGNPQLQAFSRNPGLTPNANAPPQAFNRTPGLTQNGNSQLQTSNRTPGLTQNGNPQLQAFNRNPCLTPNANCPPQACILTGPPPQVAIPSITGPDPAAAEQHTLDQLGLTKATLEQYFAETPLDDAVLDQLLANNNPQPAPAPPIGDQHGPGHHLGSGHQAAQVDGVAPGGQPCCYVLSWLTGNEAADRPGGVWKEDVSTTEALREELNRPESPPPAPKHGDGHGDGNGDGEGDDALIPVRPFLRVAVMHGLPPIEFIGVLMGIGGVHPQGAQLEVDRRFIEALAVRDRRYRPAAGLERCALRRRFKGDDVRVPREGGYIWEHPEFVDRAVAERMGRKWGDAKRHAGPGNHVVYSPMIYDLPRKLEDGSPLAVVFVRLGLWSQRRGAAVFLDELASSQGVPGRQEAMGPWRGSPATLEDVMVEAFKPGWSALAGQLPGTVAEVVYHRWLELFDYLETRHVEHMTPIMRAKMLGCYTQMMRSLELNSEVDDGIPWEPLIERVTRRIAVVSTLAALAAVQQPLPLPPRPFVGVQTPASPASHIARAQGSF